MGEVSKVWTSKLSYSPVWMTRGPEIDRGWVGSVAQLPGPDLAPANQINHTHNVTKQNLQSLLHNDIYLPFNNSIHLTLDCRSLKWLPITFKKSTWVWGFQQKFSSPLFRLWAGCHQSPGRLAAAPPPEPSRHVWRVDEWVYSLHLVLSLPLQ